MNYPLHVAVCGGAGLLRTAAVLTRAQIGRVPVPPVVLGVRLLIEVMMLPCLAEEPARVMRLRASVAAALPADRYTGVVLDTTTGRPVGRVTIEVVG